MSMARREVLVQLDDDLVARLDELARARGTNRSELIRRGARAVIEAEALADADAALAEAYRSQAPDPHLLRSAERERLDPAPAGHLDGVKRSQLDTALRYALDITY